jgi:hypothetical protein
MYSAVYNRPKSLVVLELRLETILALLNLNSYVCVDLSVQDKLRETEDKIKYVFFQTTVMVRRSLKAKKQKEKDRDKERHIKANYTLKRL